VLCYTGEVDGKYTGAIARWKDVGDFYTSLARWTTGPTGTLPDNMVVTQEVKNGVNAVQLHLDPERKEEPFAGLPRVTNLHGLPGRKPEVQKMTMHWTSADTVAVEILLAGHETALATVEIPGQKPVALPPVCLPYSPEFKPVTNEMGLAALEHLGRATGGKERVELAGIWKDLPKHPRLLAIGPWLLIAALVVLLLEVLERRTGLVSRQGRLLEQTAHASAAAGKHLFRKHPRLAETPPLVPPQPPEETRTRRPAPAPAADHAGLLEALRQARQRTRGK
jgi:hypothetical protein